MSKDQTNSPSIADLEARIKRAEACAEWLATYLDALSSRVALMNWEEKNPAGAALVPPCRAALATWDSYKADYVSHKA